MHSKQLKSKRFYMCLIASAFFMVAGHVVIGQLDEKKRNAYETYNVRTYWVSDYAAKWPEGLYIKASIVLFCICIGILTRNIILCYSPSKYHYCFRFWWLLLATFMIGGLLMVAIYDNKPTGGTLDYLRSWIPFAGNPKNTNEDFHHDLGFGLFLFGYMASLLTVGLYEWKHMKYAEFTTTAYLILLSSVLSIWALLPKVQYFPGIPQRFLLIGCFAWLVIMHRRLRRAAAAIPANVAVTDAGPTPEENG